MDEAFAKAFETICQIFNSVQCNEFIYPEYLSRFYYILQQGLRFYHGDEVKLITEKKKIYIYIDCFYFCFCSILATFSSYYRIYTIE